MLTELLSLTLGPNRAQDLIQVLAADERLHGPSQEVVPAHVMAGALHFLLFEELLKRSPSTLAIAGEALQAGEKLTLDHAALATLEAPYCGALGRGRHHLGQILEPLGYVQTEAYAVHGADATAHIYTCPAVPGAVPDFVIMEIHGLRFDPDFQAVARSVFGEAPYPGGVRVQAALKRLNAGEGLTLEQAAEFLQGIFVWFGRQHVPPQNEDYATLAQVSGMAAWMAHEGQGLSHMGVRVDHLSVAMDMQLRQGRELQMVKTSLDQATKLVGLVPDVGPRPFRDSTGRITQLEVPIANLAFIERGPQESDVRFEPGLF